MKDTARPGYAYTNAPKEYDYHYTSTVEDGIKDSFGKEWRLVKYEDRYRFDRFQTPRYQSGLKQVITMAQAKELEIYGLKRI